MRQQTQNVNQKMSASRLEVLLAAVNKPDDRSDLITVRIAGLMAPFLQLPVKDMLPCAGSIVSAIEKATLGIPRGGVFNILAEQCAILSICHLVSEGEMPTGEIMLGTVLQDLQRLDGLSGIPWEKIPVFAMERRIRRPVPRTKPAHAPARFVSLAA